MHENKEGQTVPEVSFACRVGDDWQTVTTDDIFKGKTVVLFALPGAFTPTCSSTHLPRYNELAPKFKSLGVDEIVCLSVNDTFVMNAWAQDQDAENIRLLPDGNGEFSHGMGMLVDKNDLGFGKRSWRYAMLVKDKVIEKMFIEPDVPGDPFEVSDADTMLNYISPNSAPKHSVVMFSKSGCPYCDKARALLKAHDYDFEELKVGGAITLTALRAASGRDTVPQVFIDGKHIGGSDDLADYFA